MQSNWQHSHTSPSPSCALPRVRKASAQSASSAAACVAHCTASQYLSSCRKTYSNIRRSALKSQLPDSTGLYRLLGGSQPQMISSAGASAMPTVGNALSRSQCIRITDLSLLLMQHSPGRCQLDSFVPSLQSRRILLCISSKIALKLPSDKGCQADVQSKHATLKQ